MRSPLQGGWLLCLIIVLLAGCGNKKENNVIPAQPVTASPVETRPVAAATAARAAQQTSKLVLLPEAPTAKDMLLAVFKGEAGQVKYRWEKNGETLDGEKLDRLAVKHLQKGAVITVIVDNAGASYSASVTIGNLPPVVEQVTFKDPVIHRGVDIQLLASGDDADGDDITFNYKWYRDGNEMTIIDGPTLPGDQFNRGDRISFQVIPFDGVEEGAPYEGSAFTIPNAPPLFVSNPPLQFLSETYTYQARAIDPDDDAITYALENPPPGMKINSKTGQINWPLVDLPAGDYRISIVAVDSQEQKAYQEYSLSMSRQ